MRLRDYQTFFVDLDDTLYLERDYVLSGLSAVARYLAQDGLSFTVLENWLHRRFLKVGREHIFDRCLAAFDLPCSAKQIETLVSVYRDHEPQLQFLPGAREVLMRLSKIGQVIIVTDGLPSMQAKKCRSLNLARWADSILYCWEYQAPKPSPVALEPLVRCSAGSSLLIGDNPRHDLCMAEKLQIDAIRVRQGRFAKIPSMPWTAQLEVDSIAELLDYLMA